ncbi:MAG: bifunctional demethylmenaquinone methyltransferase/2-methoxy-6-polyprenyl-1,4-benzoquinol methylase UbiE [Thermoflexibacter sp.]|jgi:demethylmenaquinone methyltransferase/2-methoxy-6-polyprenyl-1,4-benzoquinol methylase|nr:bifunctional demethylmenaquinone methyltransferase/2-methoxy-6-polyprenyl-1,4-benzoquinol methylase UbiE [Thermoflexibacter sp.]
MTVVPYKDQSTSKKEQVAQMFDNISPKYDLLNRVLSMGIDISWRKKAIKMLEQERPKLILDVATGTADFALEALSLNPDKIIGVDISEGMLALGKEKIKKMGLEDKIELQMGDSEKLLFDDDTFDAVIVSFGVRNFENLEKGLQDICRVLKKGGTLIVLEFSQPQGTVFRNLYHFYSKYILPTIGRLISKDNAAYTYLPESVKAFPYGKEFLAIMGKVGFVKTEAKELTLGISSIYKGKKA